MVCGDHNWSAGLATVIVLDVNVPFVSNALDMAHLGLRKNFRAVVHRVGQVVHKCGVFRPHIAARDTVTAIVTRRLRHAKLVGLILEIDVDRCLVEALAHHLGRVFQRLQLTQCRVCVGIGVGRKHFARALIISVDHMRIIAERLGPMRLVKQALVELQRDVGVDQRCPAKTAAHERILVIVHVHFKKRIGRADAATFYVELHRILSIADLVGVLARQHFPAAFEDTHILPCARQTRGGDACAIA